MAYKKKNTPKVEPKGKTELTPQELIQVGNFATRVGNVLAGLEAEKTANLKTLDNATYVFNTKREALDEKINLVTSDPVKYFRILDTQLGFGLLGADITNTKGSVGAPANLDNFNLSADVMKQMISKLDGIYNNSSRISDMIYDETRYSKQDRRYFDPRY